MAGEAVERGRSAAAQATDPMLSPEGRYVVGFDGGSASTAALAWAAARALPRRALHVVGVVAEHGSDVEERLGRQLSNAAARLLEVHPGAAVTTETARGTVEGELARAAGPADLLVVGSDKTGYVSGRVFGLRSIQLAPAVRGAMAVIPSVDLRLRAGVAVAVADAGSAASLARSGALEAARAGGSLAIVHASPFGGDVDGARAQEVLAVARSAAIEVDASLDVWAHVARRHPAQAILDLARDRALLLLGRSRGSSALGVGPTLHEVLMNVNAPTAILE